MSTRSDDRRSTAKPAPAVEPYRWEVRPGCRTHAGRWSCSTRPYTPRGTVGVHTGWHRHEVLSFVVPSGRLRMRENRVRSLAEVGVSWRSEPVFEFDPGSRWWGCALSLRARGSDSLPSLFGSCRRPPR